MCVWKEDTTRLYLPVYSTKSHRKSRSINCRLQRLDMHTAFVYESHSDKVFDTRQNWMSESEAWWLKARSKSRDASIYNTRQVIKTWLPNTAKHHRNWSRDSNLHWGQINCWLICRSCRWIRFYFVLFLMRCSWRYNCNIFLFRLRIRSPDEVSMAIRITLSVARVRVSHFFTDPKLDPALYDFLDLDLRQMVQLWTGSSRLRVKPGLNQFWCIN